MSRFFGIGVQAKAIVRRFPGCWTSLIQEGDLDSRPFIYGIHVKTEIGPFAFYIKIDGSTESHEVSNRQFADAAYAHMISHDPEHLVNIGEMSRKSGNYDRMSRAYPTFCKVVEALRELHG